MITIELTEEEAEVLKKVLTSAQLSGNIQSLTTILSLIAGILKKLEQ